MKKYLNVLKSCPLFLGIEEGDIPGLLCCLGAVVEGFDKKYTVLAEGTAAKYIGIVLSGEVLVEQTDYMGNRSILANIREGEIFGESFACANIQALPVSVSAAEPCEIMFFDSSRILHTCKNCCGFHQTLIYNLMRDLAQKSIMFHQKIDVTSKRTTREKLLTYLSGVARGELSRSFYIPFDRQQLADYLEVDRSGLSAEISKLRKEGIIESNKNYFRLLG